MRAQRRRHNHPPDLAAQFKLLERTFPVGSLVWFPGTMGTGGSLLSVSPAGTDWFMARVVGYTLSVAVALEFADGRPVGIPFVETLLVMAERG